ncbi:MAG: NAD-dependent epimerase/dehydratase family protein [Pirellula sp.]|jgi:nucleoside-diphosphate-sugar epimerase
MHVVITGGGGFLGAQLCNALIERGSLENQKGDREPIEQILLVDKRFSKSSDRDLVSHVDVDISNRSELLDALPSKRGMSFFHLASMVSGECEESFDDALRVNLDGGRNLFEAARRAGANSRVVFASSIACFGGVAMKGECHDHMKLTPQTTYGMTKAICELLINDHSRKGHFDGRSARLPTVIVRPGKPNAAASSWASGMFREPLHGHTCLLPIRRSQPHPMTGYRTVIESLIELHNLPSEDLGDDRAVGLPAMSVTPIQAAAVLRQVASKRNLKLGEIVDDFQPRIQKIVDNWPTAIDGRRGLRLGLPNVAPLEQIVEEYLTDFGNK